MLITGVCRKVYAIGRTGLSSIALMCFMCMEVKKERASIDIKEPN